MYNISSSTPSYYNEVQDSSTNAGKEPATSSSNAHLGSQETTKIPPTRISSETLARLKLANQAAFNELHSKFTKTCGATADTAQFWDSLCQHVMTSENANKGIIVRSPTLKLECLNFLLGKAKGHSQVAISNDAFASSREALATLKKQEEDVCAQNIEQLKTKFNATENLSAHIFQEFCSHVASCEHPGLDRQPWSDPDHQEGLAFLYAKMNPDEKKKIQKKYDYNMSSIANRAEKNEKAVIASQQGSLVEVPDVDALTHSLSHPDSKPTLLAFEAFFSHALEKNWSEADVKTGMRLVIEKMNDPEDKTKAERRLPIRMQALQSHKRAPKEKELKKKLHNTSDIAVIRETVLELSEMNAKLDRGDLVKMDRRLGISPDVKLEAMQLMAENLAPNQDQEFPGVSDGPNSQSPEEYAAELIEPRIQEYLKYLCNSKPLKGEDIEDALTKMKIASTPTRCIHLLENSFSGGYDTRVLEPSFSEPFEIVGSEDSFFKSFGTLALEKNSLSGDFEILPELIPLENFIPVSPEICAENQAQLLTILLRKLPSKDGKHIDNTEMMIGTRLQEILEPRQLIALISQTPPDAIVTALRKMVTPETLIDIAPPWNRAMKKLDPELSAKDKKDAMTYFTSVIDLACSKRCNDSIEAKVIEELLPGIKHVGKTVPGSEVRSQQRQSLRKIFNTFFSSRTDEERAAVVKAKLAVWNNPSRMATLLSDCRKDFMIDLDDFSKLVEDAKSCNVSLCSELDMLNKNAVVAVRDAVEGNNSIPMDRKEITLSCLDKLQNALS